MANELRVLDVGCGPGIYVDALSKYNHITATGIDLDKNNPYLKIDIFSDTFLEYTNYDITLCIEVAEHLPPDLADEFVRRLCNTADVILFSAAHPGQGGHGHINCQDKAYWIEKFNNNNFVLDEPRTNNLVAYMQNGYHMGWFAQNAMVFKSYGKMYYDKIIEEETPQAIRLAEYIVEYGL